jgi:hypothetical protein
MAGKAVKKPPALKIKVGAESSVQAIAPGEKDGSPELGKALTAISTLNLGAMKVVMPDLEVIANPATKSKYYVVGTSKDGLKVSLRFFRTNSDKGHTGVGFRLRIGDQDLSKGDFIGDVRSFLRERNPDCAASFNATSPVKVGDRLVYTYSSVDGALDINREPWDTLGISAALQTSDFIEELWYVILRFSDGNFAMNRPQFGAWVIEQVRTLYSNIMQPQAPQPQMKYKLGTTGARLMSSDKTKVKMTKKEAIKATGL